MQDYEPLDIVEVKRETADAVSVALAVPAARRAAFGFKPGQHLPVRAAIAGEEQRRTYSICSGPGEDALRIAIKRIPDGRFSNWANDTLQAGARLEAMPPAGRFVLPDGGGDRRHVVGIAAGVGITPVIAMIKYALAREPLTSLTLVYGNRAPESTIFREELEDLKDRHMGRFALINVLSRNDETSAPLLEGRITADKVKALAPRLFAGGEASHIFLCGPGSMIRDVRNALFELGLPREKVHHEFFAPGGGAFRTRPQAAAAPETARNATQGTGGTEVVAILDGLRHRFTVPANGHVVDAALAAGVRVPYSCKGGMCCTCRAKLVEGRVEMTQNYSLEPWEIERGFVLTCQAVPKSERVVLDYDQM